MAQVFKKLYPQSPVNMTTGKTIRFEDFGNNTGYIVTDDPQIIQELTLCMKDGRGGISPSSIEEYQAAVKKKLTSPASNNKLFRENQTSGLITIAVPPVVASPVVPAIAGNEVALEVTVLPASVTPKVGKRPVKT